MAFRLLGPTGIWALLIGATLLSYLSWLDIGWHDPRVGGSLVILIALGKAWLIGRRYMELDEAILPLRLAYDGWLLVVGTTLLMLFWLA